MNPLTETMMQCKKCDGCGRVAATADEEPWSVWANLPTQSATAVLLGLVKPKPCPSCGGSGKEPADEPTG